MKLDDIKIIQTWEEAIKTPDIIPVVLYAPSSMSFDFIRYPDGCTGDYALKDIIGDSFNESVSVAA